MVGVGRVAAPDVPAGTIDHVAETCILEHHASIVAPRATEVVGPSGNGLPGCCGYGGLVDDIVGWVRGRVAAVGGDVVASIDHSDVHAVEPGD